ncbi:alpha/beta fold hydrolase [Micromonospora sp. CA-240977]|uniref:alpha/beta fold hydrolase n=1 Tax=Micromonospora sp. CA-240977 TaxID=3239957 RepID=UPI003D91A5B1
MTATAALFSVPAPIRLAYRVADRIAPAVSARWAEQVWMTLPKPSKARPMAESGTPFRVGTLLGRTWGDGPPIYLAHGWAGYHGQFAAFIPALIAAGYRVVGFDMPSHGRSGPGRFGPQSSSIPEFAEALAAVVAEHGPAYAVIAHSIGATATAAALRSGLTAERLALIAPMAIPSVQAQQLAAVLGFGERTHRRLLDRIEARVGVPMRDLEMPATSRACAVPPALLVHDTDDRTTPSSGSEAIVAAWPGSTLYLTTGLGHNRLLRDRDVVAAVTDFVTHPNQQALRRSVRP